MKQPRATDSNLDLLLNQALSIEQLLQKNPDKEIKDQQTPRKKFFPNKVSRFSRNLPKLESSSSHLISSSSSEMNSNRGFVPGSQLKAPTENKNLKSILSYESNDENFKPYFFKKSWKEGKFPMKSSANMKQSKLDKTQKRILTTEIPHKTLYSQMGQRHREFSVSGYFENCSRFSITDSLFQLRQLEFGVRLQNKGDIVRHDSSFFQ